MRMREPERNHKQELHHKSTEKKGNMGSRTTQEVRRETDLGRRPGGHKKWKAKEGR